jgi:uncharacterized protein YyaL (SSP411 family)
VSKQDSKFFNIFSLVLGILIVITVVLFSLARSVGDNTQKTHLLSDPKYVAAVEGRIGKTEVAVVGSLDDPATHALITAARGAIGPYGVIAAGDPGDDRAVAAAPLLADRPLVDGRPAAYACSGFACRAPVTNPVELAAQIDTT